MVLERSCANTFAKVGPKVGQERPQTPYGEVLGVQNVAKPLQNDSKIIDFKVTFWCILEVLGLT